MTKAQDVFLVVIACAFLVWGVNKWSANAAGVLALVIAALLVGFALFGKI